jgi:hypothetical protein
VALKPLLWESLALAITSGVRKLEALLHENRTGDAAEAHACRDTADLPGQSGLRETLRTLKAIATRLFTADHLASPDDAQLLGVLI